MQTVQPERRLFPLFDPLCSGRVFSKGAVGQNSVEIVLEDQRITGYSPIQRRQLGVAYIPEDRWKEGMIAEFSIQENFMLHSVGLGQNDRFWVDSKSIQETVGKCIEQFRIQAQSMIEPISSLSGGHQQRAVVARELLQSPKLIIAHNPSRGLDIRATRFVHEILHQEAAQGAAIVLFSSDLEELFQLANRIGVLYKGRLIEVRQSDQWNGYELGKAMIGGNA
jgi:simple sugar transport system ATP-binding protein